MNPWNRKIKTYGKEKRRERSHFAWDFSSPKENNDNDTRSANTIITNKTPVDNASSKMAVHQHTVVTPSKHGKKTLFIKKTVRDIITFDKENPGTNRLSGVSRKRPALTTKLCSTENLPVKREMKRTGSEINETKQANILCPSPIESPKVSVSSQSPISRAKRDSDTEVSSTQEDIPETPSSLSSRSESLPLLSSAPGTPLRAGVEKSQCSIIEPLSLSTEPIAEDLAIDLDALLAFSLDKQVHRFSDYVNIFTEKITKLGEASYSEVFLLPATKTRETQVLKIIPFGDNEHSCRLEDVLQEVRLSKCMKDVEGFIKFDGMSVVQGMYPDLLLRAWDEWVNGHESFNERPAFYMQDQMFIIIFLEHGGRDLENFKVRTWVEAANIFWSVVEICARGEEEREFEHRDLHWGNILIKEGNDSTEQLFANLDLNEKKSTDASRQATNRKLVITLIDYTLSRARCDDHIGSIAYHPMADQGLFKAQGEYQFDIYRFMNDHVSQFASDSNPWKSFMPKTTIYWLHYLSDKLLFNKGLSRPINRVTARSKRKVSSQEDREAYDILQTVYTSIDPKKKKFNRDGEEKFIDARSLFKWGRDCKFFIQEL